MAGCGWHILQSVGEFSFSFCVLCFAVHFFWVSNHLVVIKLVVSILHQVIVASSYKICGICFYSKCITIDNIPLCFCYIMFYFCDIMLVCSVLGAYQIISLVNVCWFSLLFTFDLPVLSGFWLKFF